MQKPWCLSIMSILLHIWIGQFHTLYCVDVARKEKCLFTLMQRFPGLTMCWILPGTSMDLNLAGRSDALWGMCRSPSASTSTMVVVDPKEKEWTTFLLRQFLFSFFPCLPWTSFFCFSASVSTTEQRHPQVHHHRASSLICERERWKIFQLPH